MGWRDFWRAVPPQLEEPAPVREIHELALTSAAHVVQSAGVSTSRRVTPKYDTWQDELWNYYETLGEFNIAVTWRSYMMSRVRLRAAKLKPGSDEPEIIDNGPAADLINELFNGTAGQSEMMGNLSIMMDVPAECWLVGEGSPTDRNVKTKKNTWRVLSSDEIRRKGKGFEVITDDSIQGDEKWRPLSADSYITRIWKPHKRKRYLPYSQAFAARSAMRELELVNRHIIAQYLSRLASAGVILFPDEIQFPVRPEFLEAPDPFVSEWIEMAAEAIKTPGAASSIVPIPFKVPAEYVDKVKHIDFTLKLDEKIIEKRDSARNRLAAMINVPAELLFQAADVNHWGLWQLEEGAIRTYITPDAEVIINALTIGYLRPRMKAQGEADAEEYVVWYDTSELQVRPDKSENAIQAYDRLELTGKALRRETGFDEDDAPTEDELADIILKKLAVQPQLAIVALNKLTGLELEQPQPQGPPPPGAENGDDVEDDDEDDDETSSDGASTDGPPSTRDDAPPNSRGVSAGLAERDAFTILQAKTQHMIEFSNLTGWKLKHPPLCQPKLFSCPFTHVTYHGIPVHPGYPGNYACWLSATGELVIGDRVFTPDDSFIPSPARSTANGARTRA